MEALIADITASAGRLILDPAMLGGSALASLLFVSGAAGRLLELIESRSAGRSR
jgi:hypothetical protein